MNTDLLIGVLLEEEEEEELIINQFIRSEPNDLYSTRFTQGFYSILINSHLKKDETKFREFFRLNIEQFNFVLNIIQNDLTKGGSNANKNPINAEEKFALTLRHLATGESFRSLAFAFRISHSYVSIIVQDVLTTLCEHLVPIFTPPTDHEHLKKCAIDFFRKWHFPNCVGAIDGKHVRIFCPNNSGSLFYNYKGYFSIVLLAIVDANYKFIAIDVGSYGKEGDSGIINKSVLGSKILSGEFFPPDMKLPESDNVMPCVIVGDEAFRLHRHILKPYTRTSANADKSKAIFNYRLSRARRVSENAFGLLSQIFRIFYTPIAVKPETCDKMIIACCCLHNLLREGYLEKNNKIYYDYDSNSEPNKNFLPLACSGGFEQSEGFIIRDRFKEYFNQDGSVFWQNDRVA